jgi:hypothetical protein
MKLEYVTLLALALTITLGTIPNAIAETIITPINDELSIKKTIIPMNIPESNEFPWGSVRGQASEIAERYPIIIQIFKGDDPVHFAQVDPKGDGSFEYKFRIRNTDVNTGEAINIFQGEYTVNIFRVVPNPNPSI